jgi:hypothetical protein
LERINYLTPAARLLELEALHHICDMYIWLSYRFEDHFTQRLEAIHMKKELTEYIEHTLESKLGPIGRKAKQSKQGRGKPETTNMAGKKITQQKKSRKTTYERQSLGKLIKQLQYF